MNLVPNRERAFVITYAKSDPQPRYILHMQRLALRAGRHAVRYMISHAYTDMPKHFGRAIGHVHLR
jgi:hypothetical protein